MGGESEGAHKITAVWEVAHIVGIYRLQAKEKIEK